ncbi:MAG: DUF4340 domain-containing protein, partial [Deltaproteobacteria bacterium]|nr:DUF4340 domain-containing protein [Deltaproteobacteria bacterium]
FKSDDVTKVVIEAMQSEKAQPSLTLTKDGDHFVVTSADNFKAKDESVKEMLDQIIAIQIEKDNPIATSKANHSKLGVASDSFDRKVTLTANGKETTLYLGRGSRSSATVRIDGSDNVFDAPRLSVWNINSKVSNYIDTEYVSADESNLTEVSVKNSKGTLNFVKQGDKWTDPSISSPLLTETDSEAGTDSEQAGEQKLDEAEVKRFIGKISNITIDEPVGKTSKPEYGLDKGTTVTLKSKKDDKPFTITYNIGEKAENDRYIKSSDSEYVIKASSYQVEDATTKTQSDFLKKPGDENEPDQDNQQDMQQQMMQQQQLQQLMQQQQMQQQMQ